MKTSALFFVICFQRGLWRSSSACSEQRRLYKISAHESSGVVEALRKQECLVTSGLWFYWGLEFLSLNGWVYATFFHHLHPRRAAQAVPKTFTEGATSQDGKGWPGEVHARVLRLTLLQRQVPAQGRSSSPAPGCAGVTWRPPALDSAAILVGRLLVCNKWAQMEWLQQPLCHSFTGQNSLQANLGVCSRSQKALVQALARVGSNMEALDFQAHRQKPILCSCRSEAPISLLPAGVPSLLLGATCIPSHVAVVTSAFESFWCFKLSFPSAMSQRKDSPFIGLLGWHEAHPDNRPILRSTNYICKNPFFQAMYSHRNDNVSYSYSHPRPSRGDSPRTLTDHLEPQTSMPNCFFWVPLSFFRKPEREREREWGLGRLPSWNSLFCWLPCCSEYLRRDKRLSLVKGRSVEAKARNINLNQVLQEWSGSFRSHLFAIHRVTLSINRHNLIPSPGCRLIPSSFACWIQWATRNTRAQELNNDFLPRTVHKSHLNSHSYLHNSSDLS